MIPITPETEAAVQRIGHSKTPEEQLVKELEHLNTLIADMEEQREVDQREHVKALYSLNHIVNDVKTGRLEKCPQCVYPATEGCSRCNTTGLSKVEGVIN